MKSRWVRKTIAAVAVTLVGITGQLAHAQRGDSSSDTRQRVALTPVQRNQILAEMRGMLESMRGILFALASNDIAAVAKAAQPSTVEASANPELDKRLPEGFLKFRRQTHQEFTLLTGQSRAGATQPEMLRRLAGITNELCGLSRGLPRRRRASIDPLSRTNRAAAPAPVATTRR